LHSGKFCPDFVKFSLWQKRQLREIPTENVAKP
jgi:hypothetical protein